MANEDIKSEISRVQREISRVQSEINEINSELNQISAVASSAVSSVMASHGNFDSQANRSIGSLDYANKCLNATMQAQLQIKELFYIFKDIETANKKIRALRNQLFYEFRNQTRVRKIVNGLIDNLNFNLVSNETIYKAIEKEHLQAPDFWLTYCLLAIMNWKENNKEKVDQCIDEALKLNEKSTVLFMMQFNLLLSRYDAALKWLKIYETLEIKGSDDKTLLMIISSVNSKINNFDNRVNPFALEILEYIKGKIAEDNQLVDREVLVLDVLSFLDKLDTPETLKYDYYRQYVTDYQTLANALSKAKNNTEILEYFTELSHVNLSERNTVIDNYMQKLIAEPCEGEKKIYDEIAYNEEIIKAVDEIKQKETYVSTVDFKKIAEERYNNKKIHDESKLNSVVEMLNWSYNGVDENITSLTRWNIFVLTKDYAEEAYGIYKKRYLASNPQEHKVVIEEFNCQTKFNNVNDDLNQIDKFINQKKADLIKNARKPLFYIGIALAIVLIGLGIYGFISLSNITLLIVGLVLGAIAGLVAVFALLSNLKKKRNIEILTENNRKKYKEIMQNIYKDKAAFDAEFKEADLVSKDIDNFFKGIK